MDLSELLALGATQAEADAMQGSDGDEGEQSADTGQEQPVGDDRVSASADATPGNTPADPEPAAAPTPAATPADPTATDDADVDPPIGVEPVDQATLKAAKDALDGYDGKLQDLRRNYDDGDLDPDEYVTAREKLMDERAAAADQYRGLSNQAVQYERAAAAAADAKWDRAVDAFTKQDPVHLAVLKDPVTQGLVAAEVNDLFAKHPRQSYPWLIRTAVARVQRDYADDWNRVAATVQKPAAPAQQQPQKQKPAGYTPDDIPLTLGNLPAGADNGGGEFDALDRLGGLEYEQAIAAMPEEKRRRYLAGA